MDLLALDHFGRGPEVFQAGIGAGADEDSVDLDVGDRHAGLQVHVLQGASQGVSSVLIFGVRRVRDPAADGRHHTGSRAPSNVWLQIRRFKFDQFAVLCSGVGSQSLPPLHRGIEVGSLGSELAAP